MAHRYFKLEPEVAGGWGERTIADTTVHPPVVMTLHLELEGWLGDDLLETFPCFVVTERMAEAMEEAQLSGYSLADVEVSKSDQFEELFPGLELPRLRWLRATGAVGREDICVLPDATLAVSDRALAVFRTLRMKNCAVTPIDA